MNHILDQLFKEAKSKISTKVSGLKNTDLNSSDLGSNLYKQNSVAIPDLDLKNVPAPQTGEEVMRTSNAPVGMPISSSDKPIPFVSYTVRILGNSNLCSKLLNGYLERGTVWINHGDFCYKQYHSELKTSSQVQESIKEGFKKIAQQAKAHLESYQVDGDKGNEDLKIFIDETIAHEIKSRDDKSNLEKNLNPFA